MVEGPKFSLVMSTLGRTDEIERFLNSLKAQTYRCFELIIVDQNGDDRLDSVVAPFTGDFPILRLRSGKGVCRGRNTGLSRCTGDSIGFPDDDCWYPPDLLERIAAEFRDHPDWDGLSACPVNDQGRALFGRRRAVREDGWLNKISIWSCMMTFTLFIRSQAARMVEGFDESLGPGCPTIYQAGDETEYGLRLLEAGAKIYYRPDLVVFHPDPRSEYSPATNRKAYFYACGFGKVLAMHRYPLWYKIHILLRALGGTVVNAARLRPAETEFHWNRLRGRLRGLTGK